MLVLDNVNRLAQKNPELLDMLQDIAKDAADDRIFTTVFVMSEGQAPIQMIGKFCLDSCVNGFGDKYANYILWIHIGRSASSRLGVVMEIGDLTQEEATDFLCNKRAISKLVAKDIYQLVGGRVGLLVSAVNKLNSGLDLAGFSPTQYLK